MKLHQPENKSSTKVSLVLNTLYILQSSSSPDKGELLYPVTTYLEIMRKALNCYTFKLPLSICTLFYFQPFSETSEDNYYITGPITRAPKFLRFPEKHYQPPEQPGNRGYIMRHPFYKTHGRENGKISGFRKFVVSNQLWETSSDASSSSNRSAGSS